MRIASRYNPAAALRRLMKRRVGKPLSIPILDKYMSRRYAGRYPMGHPHAPLPDLHDVAGRSDTLFRTDVDLNPSIDLREEGQLGLVESLAPLSEGFDWPEKPSPERRFHLDQPWFRPGDAFMMQALLRNAPPRRVLELGAGYSSALILDTCERFLDPRPELTFVDPDFGRLNSLLRPGDRDVCRLLERRAQDLPLDMFHGLDPGDMLLVDSSHVAKIGSDVSFLLFDVFPVLRPGVVIHIHDIFWPFEYPREWVLKGRAFNEAYMLRAFLQYNDRFEILIFNDYLARMHPDHLRRHCPPLLAHSGGSLWLRKT